MTGPGVWIPAVIAGQVAELLEAGARQALAADARRPPGTPPARLGPVVALIEQLRAADVAAIGNAAGQRPRWVPILTAAAQLGIPPRTLRHQAARGTIPARRVGRAWLLDVAELKFRQGA